MAQLVNHLLGHFQWLSSGKHTKSDIEHGPDEIVSFPINNSDLSIGKVLYPLDPSGNLLQFAIENGPVEIL